MTLRTVTYDTTTHKIVPIKSNGAWIDNLIKKNGEPSIEMTIQDMHGLVDELLDAHQSIKTIQRMNDERNHSRHFHWPNISHRDILRSWNH